MYDIYKDIIQKISDIDASVFELFWFLTGIALLFVSDRTDKRFKNRKGILRMCGVVCIAGAIIHLLGNILDGRL